MALRGFVLCNDGRLYHPVIAEKALKAWEKSKSQSKNASKRWQCNGNATADDQTVKVASSQKVSHGNATAMQVEGKGKGKGKQKENDVSVPLGTHAHKGGKTSLPSEFGISERVRQWAAPRGFTPHLDAHLDKFLRHCRANGPKYIDWDEAFMNCIADDWGDVRKKAIASGASRPTALSCDYRGTAYVAAAEACGMTPATRGPEYAGRPLCAHHRRTVTEANGARSGMPVSTREALSRFLPKIPVSPQESDWIE